MPRTVRKARKARPDYAPVGTVVFCAYWRTYSTVIAHHPETASVTVWEHADGRIHTHGTFHDWTRDVIVWTPDSEAS